MTDYHKILGVEKNASKEEIKEAYKKQVEKIKEEVVNEKRLNQFLKLFNEAYEALNSLEENQAIDKNEIAIISPKEVQKELDDSNKSNNYISRNESKRKGRRSSTKKNNFIEKGILKNKHNKYKLNGKNDEEEEKSRKQKVTEKSSKSNTKQAFNLIMLPFKIVAFPIIAILSIMILLLDIINVISWIATKVLIVGSISAGAIHLYQVYLGQTINYNILILAGSVLLAAFFLPYILKFVLKVSKTFNNLLKDFVF